MYSSAIVLSAFSCNDPGINEKKILEETVKTELMDFKGEQVLVSSDFPKELFNQSQEDFDKYYNNLLKKLNLRISDEEFQLSYEEVSAITTQFLNKYPDVSIEKEISEKDLERIFKDFQSITTLDQVREKSDIIVSYYDAFLKQDLLPEIVKHKNSKKC